MLTLKNTNYWDLVVIINVWLVLTNDDHTWDEDNNCLMNIKQLYCVWWLEWLSIFLKYLCNIAVLRIVNNPDASWQ
jgi:hypothetical protein